MPLSPQSKILIAEDLPDVRETLRRTLAEMGFTHVLAACDGSEALAFAEENADIALVVSDWNMEPVDGLGLLRGLRTDTQLRSVPFILVSAEAGPYRRNQAMEAGVSLFLPKPIDAGVLRKALGELGLS